MRRLILIGMLLGVAACKKKAQVVPAPPPTPTPTPVVQLPAVQEPPPPVIEPKPRPKPRPAIIPPPPVPAAPAPRLGEIVTDTRRRTLEAEYKQSVERANAALRKVAGKTLTATQLESVQRINTFLKQAETSKEKDVAEALQLARRAALLGDDLQKSLP